MIRAFVRRVAFASIALVLPSMAGAQDANPLLAVDTTSPQVIMRTFKQITDAVEKAAIELQSAPGPAKQADVERLMQKALRLLDLSQVPPTARRDVGGDAIVFLVDVLRRIDVPPLEAIPNASAFPDVEKPASWTVPGSEITISRLMQGPKKGHFVFDAETVEKAGEFYRLTKHLPLKVPSRVPSWREAQLQFHGWMIPSTLVHSLPDALKQTVLDTPLWKAIATISIVLLLAAAVRVLRRLTEPKPEEYSPASYLRRLLMPTAMIIAIFGAKFLISEQVNVIGAFAEMVEFTLAITFYVAAAWAAWFAIFVVMEWIIESPRIPDQSLDANLLRLLARIVGILSVASIAAYGAQQLGLPVLGVLAGLGVGGLAVALAAQSSIENLIGGLNLYADRPIRVGDFCEYAGINGHVEHIGLRSTRIRGLDRTITSVPNSVLAKNLITNYAPRDQMLFQHVLDLRYETTTGQLRGLCTGIRTFLSSHPKVRQDIALPRVHVVGFGDWSIKVEVYAYVDATELPKYLAIQEELAVAMIDLVRKSGAEFAFPSQTTYLAQDPAGNSSFRVPKMGTNDRLS